MQQVQSKNFMMFWFILIVFYLFVCSSAALFTVKTKKNTQASIKQIRAQQIEKLLKDKKIKGFKENQPEDAYNESLYNQGGGINPGFREMVSSKGKTQEAKSVRAYQTQLAEYRLKLAEEKQRELEFKRQQEKEAQEELALKMREMQERQASLKQQSVQKQELQTTQNKALTGALGPSKTFKALPVNTKPKQNQQKTQIGKLKTSKLGESSFQ